MLQLQRQIKIKKNKDEDREGGREEKWKEFNNLKLDIFATQRKWKKSDEKRPWNGPRVCGKVATEREGPGALRF